MPPLINEILGFALFALTGGAIFWAYTRRPVSKSAQRNGSGERRF